MIIINQSLLISWKKKKRMVKELKIFWNLHFTTLPNPKYCLLVLDYLFPLFLVRQETTWTKIN